jgi:NAD-dependent SIR2 family protein deacetylase
MYRDTHPHAGFAALLTISKKMPNGAFVFTSNVDGHFQKSGFAHDKVIECHGSIHYLQCLDDCGQPVWSANDFQPAVDTASCALLSDLPTCPECGKVARPNILMFNDWSWDSFRTDRQQSRFNAWLARSKRPVAIEIGAGVTIPTVRRFGEEIGCPLIRINPDDSAIGLRRGIGIPLGALDGISRVAQALEKL